MNQPHPQPSLLRVALVEDDEEVRNSLMMLLRSRGFAVDSYRNGMEILMNQASLQVDCLLIDYKLPRFDGIDLLEKMKMAGETPPAILITGFYSSTLRERAIKAGYRDVVEKSSDPQDMLDRLSDAARRIH
jgi:FixJ family two-component response regulator